MVSEKTGAAHVEMIFAFVIFVGFVIFLLYYIQPSKTDTLADSALVLLKDNFFEKASVNLTTVLVDFSGSLEFPCKPSAIDVPGTAGMEAKNFSAGKAGFAYIYYSNDAPFVTDKDLAECTESYPLGNINNYVVISNYLLGSNLRDSYTGDYENFKSELGLYPNADFSILANDYILEKRAPDQIKVIAGAYRKQVLLANGTLINKDFIIKVW